MTAVYFYATEAIVSCSTWYGRDGLGENYGRGQNLRTKADGAVFVSTSCHRTFMISLKGRRSKRSQGVWHVP